jgi:hypothetical protein
MNRQPRLRRGCSSWVTPLHGTRLFRCQRCGDAEKIGVIDDDRRKCFFLNQYRQQTKVTAATIFDSTKLPLANGFNRPTWSLMQRIGSQQWGPRGNLMSAIRPDEKSSIDWCRK